MGNEKRKRKERTWSIYFDNGHREREKCHTQTHTCIHNITQLLFFCAHISDSFLVLFWGARMKPGIEHYNTMCRFRVIVLFLPFCKICWFCFFLSDTFELWTCLFVHNSLFCFSLNVSLFYWLAQILKNKQTKSHSLLLWTQLVLTWISLF